MGDDWPGRGDGGIDVTAKKLSDLGPELVLVQCKRYSGGNTVGVNDVKALYADMNELDASRALIVTSNILQPGSKNYCEAREHRLNYAEVDKVRDWIRKLSSKNK